MMSHVRKYAPRLILCVVLASLIYGAMGIWIPYPPPKQSATFFAKFPKKGLL